jgi:hypothetical protein
VSTWQQALARDMERLRWGLLYALVHGGNLPPGFTTPHEDHETETQGGDELSG